MSDAIVPGFPTVPYIRKRKDERESVAAAQAFLDGISGRRSVRMFSPDAVPLEAIDLAISAANTSPSGANMQPWKFVVITDPSVKRRIREAAEAEEKENYSGRMPPQWLRALAPLQTDWHKEFLEIAPVLIAVFREDFHEEGGERILHYYVSESVGIACGILLAALNAAGLETLTHTPSPMGFLREILDRPRNEKPYLLVPVGYVAEGCRVPDIIKKTPDQVTVRV